MHFTRGRATGVGNLDPGVVHRRMLFLGNSGRIGIPAFVTSFASEDVELVEVVDVELLESLLSLFSSSGSIELMLMESDSLAAFFLVFIESDSSHPSTGFGSFFFCGVACFCSIDRHFFLTDTTLKPFVEKPREAALGIVPLVMSSIS